MSDKYPDTELDDAISWSMDQLEAKNKKLEAALADIEKRASDWCRLNPEKANLVGKTKSAIIGGTMRNILLVARDALK